MTVPRDLAYAVGLAALSAVLALAAPFEVLRAIAVLPLTLLLPGYAITVAAFARHEIGGSRLLVLSLSLSLATLAIGTFLLNYFPGGITALSWTTLLLLVVVVGCSVAALRRPAPESGSLIRLRRPHIRVADGALLLGAALAVGVAFALALTVLPAKDAIGYTRLWMLPAPGANRESVRIGVLSQEQHANDYRLVVRLGGRRAPVASRRFVLKPGHGRGLQLAVRRPRAAGSVRLTAQLFERAHPDRVYRQVTGWIPGP